MKLAIVYHTETGNTAKAAELIKAGMEKIEGVSVDLCDIKTTTADDLKEAQGILFGAPSYYAATSWQMMKFLESPLPLADKLGCAFSTANFTHGGSELVIESINMVLLAKGMLVYSSGAAHGQPFTHVGINAFAKGAKIEDNADVLGAFGERFAAKAKELFEK